MLHYVRVCCSGDQLPGQPTPPLADTDDPRWVTIGTSAVHSEEIWGLMIAWVTVGHLGVTVGHFRATAGHLRVIKGHLRVRN